MVQPGAAIAPPSRDSDVAKEQRGLRFEVNLTNSPRRDSVEELLCGYVQLDTFPFVPNLRFEA